MRSSWAATERSASCAGRRTRTGQRQLDAMKLTGILPFARKLVSELSGGEQQKVALARALAQEASILLLDEPTTFLDGPSRAEIMETIHAMHHERELTTLMVSHEPEWVEQYADKIYLLKDGTGLLTA